MWPFALVGSVCGLSAKKGDSVGPFADFSVDARVADEVFTFERFDDAGSHLAIYAESGINDGFRQICIADTAFAAILDSDFVGGHGFLLC
jgi:hypothetical protein